MDTLTHLISHSCKINLVSHDCKIKDNLFLIFLIGICYKLANPVARPSKVKSRMENYIQFQEVSKAKYNCLLFDIDDTLYPLSSGLQGHVTRNIQDFMLEKLGIEAAKVPELCYQLYKVYGTTMAGLRAIGYDFDYDEFHSIAHGRLQYDLLKPDPTLRGILKSLPIRKVIFTNADDVHAARVLHRLGLEDCFDTIISFDTLNSSNKITPSNDKDDSETRPISAGIFDFLEYMRHSDSDIVLPSTPIICKPFEDAFEKVFKIANIDPQRTMFFDDSIRNLLTAKRLGLHTVAVGSSVRALGVDHALESIHNIKEAFPDLWEAEEKHEITKYNVTIETLA
ncbi:hypothetical protein RIF29_32070 [Crotalaria pallida]|uniref:Uncharacterized protein n=1 Tax=Crotalaria pallida TaxID=3830 RepID=A0AAN9EK89_CROPI